MYDLAREFFSTLSGKIDALDVRLPSVYCLQQITT